MSLSTLHELTKIVTKNKLRSIELLQSTVGDSKIAQFYDWLLEHPAATDEEAAQYFYQADKQHNGYQKLKHTLKNRLINTVFFIDIKHPAYNDRKKAYYECYRDWAAAKILLSRNAKTTGIELSYKILKQAKHYEFTELTLDICRMLRLYYGSIEGDAKKFEYYNEQFKQYEQIWQHENLAEEWYTALVMGYVNTRASQADLHEKAQAYYALLKPALEQYDSYQLQLCGLLIEILIYSTNGSDPQAVIAVCEKGIARFKAKAYHADVPLQACYHQLLVSHLQLKQYAQGRTAAEACLQSAVEGSFNWFKYQELYFLLCMHTEAYEEGRTILQYVAQHSGYKFLPANVRETWQIYKAYVHYLAAIRKITLPEEKNAQKQFKLHKFLNETPIFSKDKRGMNVPILIIQILYLILQQKYDLAIDRMEAIEKYCARHLAEEDTKRSHAFIRMLLQIPASSFQKTAAVQRAQKYLVVLQQHPLDVANQTLEVEIIPYEQLWTFVLDTLPPC